MTAQNSGETEPLDATIGETDYSWGESALDDGSYLTTSLRSLGVPPTQLTEAEGVKLKALEHVSHAFAPNDRELHSGVQRYGPEPSFAAYRRTALGLLQDWYRSRELEYGATEVVDVQLTLFLLTAPAVQGCRTSFARGSTSERSLEWKLTIAGNGANGVKEVRVSVRSEFNAGSGEIKKVFLPARIRTTHVTVRERGRPVGTGYVCEPLDVRGAHPGVARLDSLSEFDTDEESPELFPLGGDTPTSEATYEFEVSRKQGSGIQVGFQALGAEHSVTVRTSLESSASFSCALRGGYDYHLHRVRQLPGVVWRSTVGRRGGT